MPKYVVAMAPAQVKLKPHLGNIYDWVLIDFYSKLLRSQGNEVVAPSLWNASGFPIVNLLRGQNLVVSQENIDMVVDRCIATSKKYMRLLGVDLSPTYRDDVLGAELQAHLDAMYKGVIFEKEFIGKYCGSCERILGNDPDLKECKRCKTPTTDVVSVGHFVKIRIGDIEEKAARIQYLPEGIRTALLDFARGLPKEYDLLITKDREHTTSVTIGGRSVQLDPRFVTLMTIPLVRKIHSDGEAKLVVIHGDVVKKFDYYNVAYTNDSELPSIVLTHGPCVDKDGKKIRVDPEAKKDLVDTLLEKYSPQTIRGFLLSKTICNAVTLSEDRLLETDVLRTRLNKIIERLEAAKEGKRELSYPNFEAVHSKFYELASELKLSGVFGHISHLVGDINKNYLPKLESGQFHPEERLTGFLRTIRELYFSGVENV